ncbi:MAG: DNA cytosine methyltransferase [Chloroflexota bacterium]|nr:DNA cytosine methyltransferase [Chloroflexota bacterium]
MRGLVLSLFPGIGLLDMAFEEQGFCVVRGPDLLWGGDVKRFHPPAGRFNGVIGGPPCQHWSTIARIARARGFRVAEDLIPEYVRCVEEARPDWFLMENVPSAPQPNIKGYFSHVTPLNARWLGSEQNRLRRFTFGSRGDKGTPWRHLDVAVLEQSWWEPAVLASGMRSTPVRLGGSGKTKKSVNGGVLDKRRPIAESLRLQGLPETFFEHTPFTMEGRQRMVGNGVPLPMGRAVARAIAAWLDEQMECAS